MSKASFLTRRDGRYSIQIRNSCLLKALTSRDLYRTSLDTFSYGEARLKLSGVLSWYHRVNRVGSEKELLGEAEALVQLYLAMQTHLPAEQHFAWQRYEIWLRSTGIGESLGEFSVNSRLLNFTVEESLCQDETDFSASSGFKNSLIQSKKSSLFSRNSENLAHPAEDNAHRGEKTLPDGREKARHVSSNITLSEALEQFDAEMLQQKKSVSNRSGTRLVVEFAIAVFNNPNVADWSDEDIRHFDCMLVDIPNREGIPKPHNQSLYSRYLYAKAHGWDDLHRLTEKRIKDGYHVCIHAFFDWLIAKGYFPRERPTFREVSGENLASIERDAFSESEVIRIISQPLFTGCASPVRIWVPGKLLFQNHLYWAFLISLFTGLRPGELGRLEVSDFTQKSGSWFLHIRAFDPALGRVALQNVKAFKTRNSVRMVPIPQFIMDLGLGDRLNRLKAIHCPVVFPEWEPYLPEGGTAQWGRPITKSWAYLKAKLGLRRKDIALYSTRHWFAQMMDNTDLSHMARKKVMGHADKADMAARYGSKTGFSARDLDILKEISSPEIDKIVTILMGAKQRADDGDLKTINQFESRASWSDYYRRQIPG